MFETEPALCPICGSSQARNIAIGKDFEYHTSDEDFFIQQCQKCSVLYLNPRPAISELPRIYPNNYEPYHFDEKALTFRLRRWLEKNKAKEYLRLIPKTAEVLDAGCGGSTFLENLRDLGCTSWRLWGNDISADVTEHVLGKGFETICCRFEEIDLPAESFDAIFFRQVIEHLDKPFDVLVHAKRLLKHSGILVVETPNFDAWDAYFYRKCYWGGYHIPRHWTLFTVETLSKAGEMAGLRPLQVSFSLSPAFWVQSWHHYFLDHGWPDWIVNQFNIKNPLIMSFASFLDFIQRAITGKTSNMRIIFKKTS